MDTGMNIERLLVLAIAENSLSVIAEIMNSLLAEFIEGYNDAAGDLFNKYFHTLSLEAKKKTLHTCPFEKTANRIARKYNIAEPWKQISEFEWEYIGTEKNPYDKA